MTGRKFSVWEGGSLDVAVHWVDAHLLRGRQRLKAGQATSALADFEAAKAVPENLPTERELGRDAELAWQIFYQASANRKLGNASAAEDALKRLLEAAQADLQKEKPAGQGVEKGRRTRSAGPGISHFVAGLAHLGLGERDAAKAQLTAALAASPDLLGAKAALDGLQ